MTNSRNIYRISPLSAILMLVLFIGLIYLIFRGLNFVASALLPFLIIATLIINYRVYPRYLKFVSDLYQRSLGMGLAITLLTLMCFPLVILLLFSQALFGKAIERRVKDNPLFDEARRRQQASEEEFVEYEEVDDLDLEDSGHVELLRPERKPKQRPPEKDNPYDSFF